MCSSAAGSPTPQRGVREGLVGQATIVSRSVTICAAAGSGVADRPKLKTRVRRRVMDRGRQRCEIFGEWTDIRNGSSRLTVAAATVFSDARDGFLARV